MSALGPRLSRLVAVRLGAATLLAAFAVVLALAGSALWPIERAVVAIAGLFGAALVDAATVRFANRYSVTADVQFDPELRRPLVLDWDSMSPVEWPY